MIEAELGAREHRPEQLGDRHGSIVAPASEGRGDVGLLVNAGMPGEDGEEGLVGDGPVVGQREEPGGEVLPARLQGAGDVGRVADPERLD